MLLLMLRIGAGRVNSNLINITSSEPTNRVSASAAANRSVAYKFVQGQAGLDSISLTEH